MSRNNGLEVTWDGFWSPTAWRGGTRECGERQNGGAGWRGVPGVVQGGYTGWVLPDWLWASVQPVPPTPARWASGARFAVRASLLEQRGLSTGIASFNSAVASFNSAVASFN